MPSRKSSRKSSSNKNINFGASQEQSPKKQSFSSRLASFIFTIIFQSAILYYLYNLESADCNCIKDWRHNFIKSMSIIAIILSFGTLLGMNLNTYKWFAVILMIISIINFYAFFTYIGDLNATRCSCAVDKQPNLNSVMNALRWLPIIILFFAIIMIIITIAMFGSVLNKFSK